MKFAFSGFLSLYLVIAAVSSVHAAKVPGKSVKLVPHRAVYEIGLASISNASQVSDVRGRLVYEIGGARCDGYTVNMRIVMQVTDSQGAVQLIDERSSSWESGEGTRFRFNLSEYLNSKLRRVTSGDAVRVPSKKKILIHVKKPLDHRMGISSDILFPTQHIANLIGAARMGETVLQADVYDGHEKGRKVFTTTAIIGKPHANGNKGLHVVKNANKLDNVRSWPVSIGYFNQGKAAEVPSHQIAYRLFENGVYRKLYIDYGDYALNGKLNHISFFKPVSCSKNKKKK